MFRTYFKKCLLVFHKFLILLVIVPNIAKLGKDLYNLNIEESRVIPKEKRIRRGFKILMFFKALKTDFW